MGNIVKFAASWDAHSVHNINKFCGIQDAGARLDKYENIGAYLMLSDYVFMLDSNTATALVGRKKRNS